MPYYRPVAPPLPPADSLPFPGNLIRQCSSCHLQSGCKAPVPGENYAPVDIALIGQNPGRQEDEYGQPFVGQSGQYLDSLLFQAGIPRSSVAVLNLVKCLTPGNRVPTATEIASCSQWLDLELSVIQPRIIVAMGAPAIARFLGQGAGTVEHLHGKPVETNGRIILPCYHPAAALRDTAKLRQCSEDFQVLRGLAKGHSPSEYHVRDEYPDPDYQVANTPEKLAELWRKCEETGEYAVDTEVCRGRLWSVQVSYEPGTAWLIPIPEGQNTLDLRDVRAKAIPHNYLFDCQYLQFREFTDTMVMAYLCVTRDTPILKADLTWRNAEDIRVGDKLVGFDEDYISHNGNRPRSTEGFLRRHLRKSTVDQVSVHQSECFKISFSDGRTVTCTADHKWLVSRLGCKRLQWLTVTEIQRRLSVKNKCTGRTRNQPTQYRVRSLVPGPWRTDGRNDAGWLAGIIDGEGTIAGYKTNNGVQLSIAQKEGAVLRKAENILRGLGFKATCKLYNDNSKKKNDVYTIHISGMSQVMRLLGQVRPIRMDMDFWVGKAFPNNGDEVVITSIDPVGEQDVVSITTSTGTYIANGLASHNCGQPQGLKELASRLCGIQMVNYNEIVRPGQRSISLEYLTRATKQDWPDPPPSFETKWDNKKGCIITRERKPWHISRKISKILDDMKANPEVDPYERWKAIPDEERQVVESVIGVMPESSLMDIPFNDAVRYGCRDADATLRVYRKLSKMVDDLDLNFVLDMDTNILPLVYNMMRNGMAVDVDHFRELSVDYDARMRAKSAELASLVGHSFNPNSRPQVATVVYSELGFKPTAFTPSKEISTDDQELKKTGHPVAKGVIEYRRLSKMKGTYADSLVEWARPDEQGIPRVHTTLKTTRVETGRLSSADPNLQNIPTRNKEGKAVKNGFIAPEGMLLVEGDYSQIEMVTLAHLSRCKRLIDLFLRGGDPHTEMAATIFDVPLDEAKKDKYRYPVKRLNFGIAYLIGAQGLSNQITEYIADLLMEGEEVEIEPWDILTCEKFITEWYRLNPEVKDYQLERAAEARRTGMVRDMFGRVRFIPEVTCPIRSVQEAGLRMAANMPVTASAQGIIKLAMGRLWRELPQTRWSADARFLMQIHDSLIVEVTNCDLVYKPFLRWMRDVMCGGVKLLVPVKADFKVGKRWGELKKLDLEV